MYVKDLSESKYEYLIKNRETAGIKHLNDSKAFIECSNTMNDVYENTDNYNPKRKRKILIVFDDMIDRKLNISLVFITQYYFSIPKDVRLNSRHYLMMKINNRKELQNIAINHSANIGYKDFIKIYRECVKEPYSFFDNRYYITIK